MTCVGSHVILLRTHMIHMLPPNQNRYCGSEWEHENDKNCIHRSDDADDEIKNGIDRDGCSVKSFGLAAFLRNKSFCSIFKWIQQKFVQKKQEFFGDAQMLRGR